MSTGGNVPTQGVEVKAQVDKRGPRGDLGPGTRSDRLKSLWRKRPNAATSKPISLRAFVQDLAKYRGTDPDLVLFAKDAQGWLVAKSGGTPEEKSARRLRRKERASTNLMAKQARRGKGKSQKKAAA